MRWQLRDPRRSTRSAAETERDARFDSPPWFVQPDAAQRTSVANVPDFVRTAAMELITNGVTFLRGAQSPDTCAGVISDYKDYFDARSDVLTAGLDELGRERRLVNFHHASENALEIGTNEKVMQILDFMFGGETCVYTSLTFKYGTQQPVHRDTPHFATWPESYFFGVWTALEDISPDAGPLFYYKGGHNFAVDQAAIWKRVREERPDLSHGDALDLALEIYNGQVIDNAPNNGEYQLTEMRRGDVAIWHPQLPHGGSPAVDPSHSRWSMVFHCAPAEKQVFQHQSFFENAGGEEPPARYGLTKRNNRKVALAGDVAFQ